jgi:DNA-binding IclR family transcriptional regulator
MDSSQTVERAVRILRAFDRASAEMSSSELARRVGLPRTIVVRIINALESGGFLERSSASSKYRIGLAAAEVGALHLSSNPLISAADPLLRKLAERTGYTAYLGILRAPDLVVLAVYEGSIPVRFVWRTGDRVPATTTASGKAMLMHMNPNRIDQVVGSGELVPLTHRSLRTRADLDRQLTEGRSRGWIAAVEESYPGVCAVGAAVLNSHEEPVAGLSLSFLSNPSNQILFEEVGKLVADAAVTTSERLSTYAAYGPVQIVPREPRGTPAELQVDRVRGRP